MRSSLIVLVLAGLLGACTRLNPIVPPPDSACMKEHSESSCKAKDGCEWDSCGGTCYAANAALGGPVCPVDCSAITDQATCAANSACAVYDCCGAFSCYAAGAEPPACTADCVQPECAQYTDEASCKANPACMAIDCCGAFSQCQDVGAPASACPAACIAPSCAALDTQASCDATPGCYSTFEPSVCETNGCAYVFSQCASGTPVCSSTMICPTDQPQPVCNNGFAPDYAADGCYTDCVAVGSCG